MNEDLNTDILKFIISSADAGGYFTKAERISRKVMVELVKAGRAEFLLLRDDEVSDWWGKIYNGVHERFAKHQEKIRQYNIKLEAYDKLSKEERKILGIRKPTKPKDIT